jgi:rhamnulokinase
MGMWLIQECKRIWDDEKQISWEEIVKLSVAEKPFKCLINPDDSGFLNPGNMPDAIQKYCIRTNQHIPLTKGEIARCIYDSLALKYRYTIQQIELITGEKIEVLHIIGGGANNKMMNQLTADATGIPVFAGPTEATAIGNILMQIKAAGIVDNLSEARNIVRNSFEVSSYQPNPGVDWDSAYKKFTELV